MHKIVKNNLNPAEMDKYTWKIINIIMLWVLHPVHNFCTLQCFFFPFVFVFWLIMVVYCTKSSVVLYSDKMVVFVVA